MDVRVACQLIRLFRGSFPQAGRTGSVDSDSVHSRTVPGPDRNSPRPHTSRSAIAWSSCAPHPASQNTATAANRTYPGFVPFYRHPSARDFNGPDDNTDELRNAGKMRNPIWLRRAWGYKLLARERDIRKDTWIR